MSVAARSSSIVAQRPWSPGSPVQTRTELFGPRGGGSRGFPSLSRRSRRFGARRRGSTQGRAGGSGLQTLDLSSPGSILGDPALEATRLEQSAHAIEVNIRHVGAARLQNIVVSD